MADKISVICMVYDVEPFIRQALESITCQTYENLEIILSVGVGDARDNCLDISKEYAAKDDRIKIITRDASKGIGHGRNEALKAVTGDYIGFVDGDDFIEPDMYEKLLDNMKKYGADVSVCGKYSEYEDKSIPDKPMPVRVLNSMEGLRMLLEGTGFFFHCWDKLYKKEIFDGLTFPYTRVEDRYVIGKTIYRAKKTVYDTTPLYHYRIRGDSQSRILMMSEYNTDASSDFCEFATKCFPELKNTADKCLMYDHITCIQNYLIYFKDSGEDSPDMKERYERHMAYVRAHKGDKNPEITSKIRLKIFMVLYMQPLLRLVTKKRVEKRKKENEVF